jgi:hypothetical protein
MTNRYQEMMRTLHSYSSQKHWAALVHRNASFYERGVIAFRRASDQRRLSRLMETTMRSSVLTTVMLTTIFGLFESTLIVASTANAAMASKPLTRHHKTCASETVRNANAFRPEPPNAFVGDQNGFGTTSPWPPSGIQPDDWRQSVNGD